MEGPGEGGGEGNVPVCEWCRNTFNLLAANLAGQSLRLHRLARLETLNKEREVALEFAVAPRRCRRRHRRAVPGRTGPQAAGHRHARPMAASPQIPRARHHSQHEAWSCGALGLCAALGVGAGLGVRLRVRRREQGGRGVHVCGCSACAGGRRRRRGGAACGAWGEDYNSQHALPRARVLQVPACSAGAVTRSRRAALWEL